MATVIVVVVVVPDAGLGFAVVECVTAEAIVLVVQEQE